MTELTIAPPTARPMTPGLALRDTAGVAKRNLLRIFRTPQMLVIGAFQPAMLLVLFRYVLGGAVRIPGSSYVNYIVPAVFLEAVLIGGMTTSIGLAQDLKSGIIDRFRSLPMARSAVLAGRTVADLSRSVFSLALMVVLGMAVGFRFHASTASILAGMALVLGLRLCLLLGLCRDRPGHQRPRDRPGRRHPALLHLDVRKLGDRSGCHHARLAAALCPQPASQCGHRRRTRLARRWTGDPLGLAVAGLVCGHSHRLLRHLLLALSQRHFVTDPAGQPKKKGFEMLQTHGAQTSVPPQR